MPETPSRPAATARTSKHRPPPNDAADTFRPPLRSDIADGASLESRPSAHPTDSRFVKWDVPVSDQAPAQVRRWATDLLTRWDATDAIEDVATVLTELVTNACQAGATQVIVLIEPDAGPDVLEVCVWDNAPGLPHKREPDFCAERGRGLSIVDALAVRWGHHPSPLDSGCPGKVVWAEVGRSGDGT